MLKAALVLSIVAVAIACGALVVSLTRSGGDDDRSAACIERVRAQHDALPQTRREFEEFDGSYAKRIAAC